MDRPDRNANMRIYRASIGARRAARNGENSERTGSEGGPYKNALLRREAAKER